MTGYDPPRGRDLIRPDTLLPPALRPGSEAWRWAAVCVRSMRVAAGVGLAVMATGLIGTGIALGLDGLGALRLNIPQPESEALAVGLTATMIGSALLGVAVEGAFRSPTLRPDAAPWEILVSYIPGLAVTLAITELLESWAARLLPPLLGPVGADPLLPRHGGQPRRDRRSGRTGPHVAGPPVRRAPATAS